MLSFEQKKRIFVGIPSEFNVDGVHFVASKFYANQYTREVYPAILLNYSIIDTSWAGPLNNIREVNATDLDVDYKYGAYLADVLTIDVYTADGQMNGVNSIRVADYITEELYKYFLLDFDELDIAVENISPIRNMDEDQGSYFRRRRNFDIMLRHVVEKTSTIERIKSVEVSIQTELSL